MNCPPFFLSNINIILPFKPIKHIDLIIEPMWAGGWRECVMGEHWLWLFDVDNAVSLFLPLPSKALRPQRTVGSLRARRSKSECVRIDVRLVLTVWAYNNLSHFTKNKNKRLNVWLNGLMAAAHLKWKLNFLIKWSDPAMKLSLQNKVLALIVDFHLHYYLTCHRNQVSE